MIIGLEKWQKMANQTPPGHLDGFQKIGATVGRQKEEEQAHIKYESRKGRLIIQSMTIDA